MSDVFENSKEKLLYSIYVVLIILITVYASSQILESEWGDQLFQNKERETLNLTGNIENSEEFEKVQRNADKRTFNSLGFKDEEWEIEKSNDTYRIVALGDSMTKGAFVRNNATWPEQLERKLQRKNLDINYEVMNMGGPTFDTGTYEELIAFKNISLEYNPDMLILQYYPNDWRSPEIKEKARKKWKEGDYRLPEKIKEKNLSESAISRIVYDSVLKKYYNRTDREEEWDKWVRGYIKEIKETCGEEDIKFLIITWDLPPWQEKKMEKIVMKNNISFNDFSDSLPEEKPSKFRLPDGHLTPYGYSVVANHMFEILENDFLK